MIFFYSRKNWKTLFHRLNNHLLRKLVVISITLTTLFLVRMSEFYEQELYFFLFKLKKSDIEEKIF